MTKEMSATQMVYADQQKYGVAMTGWHADTLSKPALIAALTIFAIVGPTASSHDSQWDLLRRG
jgi:hypothetical protein